MTTTPEQRSTRPPRASRVGEHATVPGPGATSSIPLPLRIVIEALVIYLVYNLLGNLNREFTPPPTGISPIWLPAGFAVGVVLTRGWWTTIPLFLTGFVNTIRADLALTDPVSEGGFGLPTSTIVWAATLYGLAIVSHCVIAKLIVDRFPDQRFESVLGASMFLVVVGPLSCVASALLGTEVFRVEGFVTGDTFAVSAFTFWIGDSIACMILAPLFVAVLGGSVWRSRRTGIVVLALATTTIVLASTSLVGSTELDRIRQTFERSTTRAVAVLEARVRRIENLALDQAALMGTSGGLDEPQFDTSAADKIDRSTGAQLMAYIAVPDGDIGASTVQFATGEGVDDFRASFTPSPIEDRLRGARDSGQVVWISQDDDPGAVDDFAYAPVYDDEVDASDLSEGERRTELTGFVAVRTDLQLALEASTDSVIDQQAASVLRAERAGEDPVVLALSPRPAENPLIDAELSPLAAARTKGVPFASVREFELGSAPWTVTFAPSRTFVTDRAFLVTILPSSIIALAFTLTIGILSLSSTGQRARLERLVLRRTRSLEASEQRYRSVVENVREAIFQLDDHDRVTFASAAWDETLRNGGRSEALGTHLTDALHVADPTRLGALITAAREQPGETVRDELDGIDGERVYEVRLATPAPAGDGRGVDVEPEDEGSIVGVVVDVTEQHRVLRNREQFVSLVAHELRNPLSVISGSVATIHRHEAEQLPPLATKLLPTVLTSAHKLDRIISDLLVSSQVDAGTLALNPESADVRALVHTAIESAQLRAIERGVQLVDETADGSRLVSRVDVDRIAQVLDNLLSNAIKYTPTGGTIAVRTEHDVAAKVIHVSITDTGIGIAPDDLGTIFERYGRTAQGVIVAPGTGLGLSICTAIAEAHGGSIEVDSTLGVGSTFTLVLPER